MKFYIILFLIGIISCSRTPKPKNNSNTANAILFLKKNFKINPNPERFDTIWLNELRRSNRSTQLDSLIVANTRIINYAPLNLNFVYYDNFYEYKDRKREDYFSIHLIEDKNTNTFYTDYINENEGMIVEDYCSWSGTSKNLHYNDFMGAKRSDIDVYNSISTDRMFGEQETKTAQRKTGIEQYLNNTFRFTVLSDSATDSLFKAYDRSFHNVDDTLIETNSLFEFLAKRTNEIRAENYGDNQRQLRYLKDQISLLLLKTGDHSNRNTRFWIYKSGRRLRIRSLLKTGNSNSGYSYFIDEEKICF